MGYQVEELQNPFLGEPPSMSEDRPPSHLSSRASHEIAFLHAAAHRTAAALKLDEMAAPPRTRVA